jgi:hypothetical protein
MLIEFQEWLALREQFKPADYDRLFNQELEKLLPNLTDSAERNRLEKMLGFRWANYIAASLRSAGFRDQGDIEEKTHDVVVKLLVSPGGLFKNYDPQRHGPLDKRFKASVGNAVRNVVELQRNRRKYLRPVAIGADFMPGGVKAEELPDRPEGNDDATLIDKFRSLLQSRLGNLALAVFDARLNGEQTKNLVGLRELGSPSTFAVKQVVQQIKNLARAFAQGQGDPEFIHDVERLMAAEAATVERRKATARQRLATVGA